MSILMSQPVVRKKRAIRVPLDSLLYLHSRCRKERCGDELRERTINEIKKNFNRFKDGEDLYHLLDGDLGGCVGPIENAWEEGRWTSWSAKQMSEMLDQQHLDWKPADDEEVIEV